MLPGYRRRTHGGILVAMDRTRQLHALPDPLEVTLRDGTTIAVRALVPEDRKLIAAGFERLSARSRYLRFFSPLPRLTTGMLDGLRRSPTSLTPAESGVSRSTSTQRTA